MVAKDVRLREMRSHSVPSNYSLVVSSCTNEQALVLKDKETKEEGQNAEDERNGNLLPKIRTPSERIPSPSSSSYLTVSKEASPSSSSNNMSNGGGQLKVPMQTVRTTRRISQHCTSVIEGTH